MINQPELSSQENSPEFYTLLPLEKVRLADLKPHPRNYQQHPRDEIAHLKESILSNGIYKNIVISSDNFILAGHGVAQAAEEIQMEFVPVYRFPFEGDDPRSMKLLVSDNEIDHLAARDDRLLSELLRELKDFDEAGGLLGTGYDEMMLANLVYVSRSEHEIKDQDAAAQWVGMPEYEEGEDHPQIVVNFASEEDYQTFCRLVGFERGKTAIKGARKSFWWPMRENDDPSSLFFASSGESMTHE